MIRTTRSPLGWVLAALGLLAAPAPAPAQTSWVPTTGGDWSVPGNWSPATVPNATSAWAQFGRGGTGSQTVNVDGTFTVGRILFGLTTTTGSSDFAHTLSGGGLTLNNGISAAVIERSRTDGDSVILTPLAVAGNNALTLRNAGFANTGAVADNTLTIASLTGTNSTVTVNPTGTSGAGVVVIQSGSYGGITNVQGSTLRAADGVGLPSNTSLRLNGGGWELPTAATITRSLGTGAGNIQLLGTAGFVAYNGPVTVRLNGGGQVQWGSANFNPTTLVFGRGETAGGSDSYTFENGLDLNGAARTVRVGVGLGVRATARLTGEIVNTSGTASGLTVGGAGGGLGTVELAGTNTYNGPTTVTGLTVLRASEGAGLSPNSNLVLNGGILEGLGATTFSRPLGAGAGAVQVVGGTSGFSAHGGTHTIQLNGGTGTVAWGGANFTATTLQFGSFSADAVTDFQNGLDLNGGARFVSVRDNPNSTGDVARISGVISGGPTGIIVFGGNGTVELTAANSYSGDTYLNDPPVLPNTTVRLVGAGSFANSPTVTVGALRTLDVTGLTGGANYNAGAGRFMVAGGQTLAGSGTVTGNVLVGPLATIRGGSPPTGLNDPTGQLTVNGSLRLIGAASAPGSTLAVDLNGASAAGAQVSRVAVTGAGNTWDFAPVALDPVTIRLLNDQNLTPGQPYSYVIGSSAGGFTRNGSPVTSFDHGTDFDLASSTFPGFTDVTLTVNGSNLVLGFTPVPVPEPATVLAIGAAGLGLMRLRRRRG